MAADGGAVDVAKLLFANKINDGEVKTLLLLFFIINNYYYIYLSILGGNKYAITLSL